MKRKVFTGIFMSCILTMTFSCKKYLDVVPNGTASLDDVWKSVTNCQQFVNTLYSQRPDRFYGTLYAPELLAGGDFITGPKGAERYFRYKSILYGTENANSSYFQFLSTRSTPAGTASYTIYNNIRLCYLLLNNVSKVPGVSKENYDSWRGEALFLIAFYHQILLEYYGPIILVKQELDLNSVSDMQLARSPFDECVQFISDKYDEAATLLPGKRADAQTGYATATMAKSYKSRLLLMAASKQFNGNATDYSDFKNKDGVQLMSQTVDKNKWKLALDAAQDAITEAESSGFRLYTHPSVTPVSDFQQGVINYHDCFTEPVFNTDEFIDIDGSTTTVQNLQKGCAPRVMLPYNTASFSNYWVPTFDCVEEYYSKNGLPMNIDPDTKNLNLYSVANGDSTALLNRNREPRFYASIGYDRGKVAVNNDSITLRMRAGELQGDLNNDNYEYQGCTGYICMKYVHKSLYWNSTTKAITYKTFVTPLLRLAELYLNYAEADFELNGSLSSTSLDYLNKIRTRAGLPNFQDSWALVGGIPQGDQLRDVLHQERSIEFAMEGRRYFDLRRWGTAKTLLNGPSKSWTIKGKTQNDFYKISQMQESGVRVFDNPKTIWLAIPIEELNTNPNMVQNPGY